MIAALSTISPERSTRYRRVANARDGNGNGSPVRDTSSCCAVFEAEAAELVVR